MSTSGGSAQAVPNFFHAESGQWYIHVTSAICLPIIVIFAGFRMYAKLGLRKRFTWDDLTCALGILSGIIFISMCLAGVAPVNTFTHDIELRKRDMSAGQLRLTLVLESLYGPFVWFIKLSLFVVIVEIFSLIRWLKILAVAGAVFTGMFYFASMVAFPSLCAPKHGTTVADYRDQLASGQCKGSFALGITVGVFSVASDLYLILIPLPAVWALQLPLRRRIAIAAMFLVGLIALSASTVSLVYRVKVSLNQDEICSFNILPNWLFAIIEMTAGIVVACMPSAFLTFNAVKPAAKSFLSNSSHYIRSKTGSGHSPSANSSQNRASFQILGASQQQMGLTGGSDKHLTALPQIPENVQFIRPMRSESSDGSEDLEWNSSGGVGEGKKLARSASRGEIWKTSHIVVEKSCI